MDGEYLEFPQRSKYDLVGIDNFRAGYLSALHFIDQGASRVDFIRLPFIAHTIPQRIMGYQQAMIDNKIIPSRDWVHTVKDFDIHNVQELLDAGVENIICGNDYIAMNLIRTLNQMGVEIPRKVRITGFDDVEAANYLSIPLTTIAQPCRKLAETIINTMLCRIKNPSLPAKKIMLDFDMKIRESSKLKRVNEIINL